MCCYVLLLMLLVLLVLLVPLVSPLLPALYLAIVMVGASPFRLRSIRVWADFLRVLLCLHQAFRRI